MIKSISLANFQSHKNTEMELSPGVNIIVGPSDSGKTALFRALSWAATNQPSGEAFRSHWGGTTEVNVEVDNHTITRRRSDGENVYVVDGKTEKAFGRGVPQTVEKCLAMTDVNWQKQMDAPFLLSSTPGDVAKRINDACRMGKIDKATSFINGRCRELTAKGSTLDEEMQNAERRMKRRYKMLAVLSPLAQEMDVQIEDVKTRRSTYLDLRGIVKRLASFERKEASMRPLIALRSRIEDAYRLANRIDADEDKTNALKRHIDHVRFLDKQINEMTTKSTNLRRAFTKAMPKRCPLCGRSGR